MQQQIEPLGESSRQEIETVKQDLTNHLAEVKAMVVTMRSLAFFCPSCW